MTLEERVDKFCKTHVVSAAMRQDLVLLSKSVAAEARDKALKEKDVAYSERNKMVCFISMLYPSHLKRHPDADTEWENDWRNIVCIHAPAGQLTWHIHDSETQGFSHLNIKPDPFELCVYDGHSPDEKYQRLFNSILSLRQRGEK